MLHIFFLSPYFRGRGDCVSQPTSWEARATQSDEGQPFARAFAPPLRSKRLPLIRPSIHAALGGHLLPLRRGRKKVATPLGRKPPQ